MGAKASTSAADPPLTGETATPSRDSHSSHGSASFQSAAGPTSRSPQSPHARDVASDTVHNLDYIFTDLHRRASLDSATSSSASRRARSFTGLVVEGGGNAGRAASTAHSLEPASGTEATFLADSAQSLPLHFMSFNGMKCPICSRVVLPNDYELHLVLCLTKPSLAYNEERLTETRPDSECVICLEEFAAGQTIARLPCLCIFHKSCIDAWFRVNRSCPGHPSD